MDLLLISIIGFFAMLFFSAFCVHSALNKSAINRNAVNKNTVPEQYRHVPMDHEVSARFCRRC